MDAACTHSGERWTAIVLAGRRPGVDPLAAAFGQRYKSLVPLRSEPMLSHVLRALLATPEIGEVVVLAQEDLLFGPLSWAANRSEVRSIVGGAGIAESVARAVAGSFSGPVLITTADHPLLTPEIMRQFISRVGDGDAAIGMVERRIMHASFPGSRRTWLRFRDGAFTGANLFALRVPAANAALRFWARAETDRKRPWRLFRHFGPVLALRAITRTISLRAAIARAGRRLGVAAQLIELDDARAGIDVDTAADHRLVESFLAEAPVAAGPPDACRMAGPIEETR